LSAEVRALMGGIKDVSEWKHYAFERFKGILRLIWRFAKVFQPTHRSRHERPRRSRNREPLHL